jgi:hypothetical protein
MYNSLKAIKGQNGRTVDQLETAKVELTIIKKTQKIVPAIVWLQIIPRLKKKENLKKI